MLMPQRGHQHGWWRWSSAPLSSTQQLISCGRMNIYNYQLVSYMYIYHIWYIHNIRISGTVYIYIHRYVHIKSRVWGHIIRSRNLGSESPTSIRLEGTPFSKKRQLRPTISCTWAPDSSGFRFQPIHLKITNKWHLGTILPTMAEHNIHINDVNIWV